MKKVIVYLALSFIFLNACNNAPKSKTKNADKSDRSTGARDAGTSTSAINSILSGYIQLSHALAQDNDKYAAEAGKTIVAAIMGLKKSSFTSEQTELYNDIEASSKEHAEHITKNIGNINHQREHFEMLSQDVYELVKAFGGGQTLYVAHCPKYNNNKGADWLTTSKEIKNPYMGVAMIKCGTIKEELK